MTKPTLFLLLSLLSTLKKSCNASIRINEVANKGSSNTCNGEDWIELFVPPTSPSQDLLNFVLHDDKGKDNDEALTFSNSTIVNPGEYLVLCRDVDFAFGIGSDDVVTLLDDGGEILSEVMLLGNSEEDQTFAFFEEGFQYTEMPTPGEENVYVEPRPLEVKLTEQNEAGNDFFLDVEDGDDGMFDQVVDLHLQIGNESLAMIEDHPTWEEFVSFEDLSISNPSDPTSSILSSSGAGKIRTKGQSTLMLVACFGFKTVPFQIEFDTPFMGMEVAYLRNHMGDPSYMRDYASHYMLRKFGLPYLRCRPVRLYMNGEYIGFYTMMEAPVQGYVMQRSFGVFDPDETALYKIKSQLAECPIKDPAVIASKSEEPPNPYYFERGDHRAAVPSYPDDLSVEEVFGVCLAYMYGEFAKEGQDLNQGILHNGNSCGEALVSLGRIDRDYGPKSTEEAMINFANLVLYNPSLSDIKPFIDSDQWIKNFAAYAVTLNHDSVIDIVNNWYLGTVDNGDSWSIVQYDHNTIASVGSSSLCGTECSNRMIYHPILRPSCKAVEDHVILGRVLNDDLSWDTYLTYVEEFVGVVESSITELRSYGHVIKEYIVDDMLADGQTVEGYEKSELDLDYSDYNTQARPLLKTLSARIVEVKAQLDAIRNDELPRSGEYGKNEICPDWRDDDGSDYIAGSAYVAELCGIPDCEQAAPCYENSPTTCVDGNLIIEECKLATPFCDACFPASDCGTAEEDISGKFVKSDICGDAFADCALGSACFDHKSGICAFDGSILTEECNEAETFCKACFPHSRCGTLKLDDDDEDEGEINDTSLPSPEDDTDSPEDANSATAAASIITVLVPVSFFFLMSLF